uniref:Fibronectin type-III domain-containing protein n=1 Tax=Timema shepardi TaxID=629360 RepID=A0A7R9AZ11_TIMSH|nr:unnamed protein product [Timema shepardi]
MTPSLDVNHRDNDVNCPVFKRKIDVQRIPGQVNLLQAIKVTTSSIQITWDSPLENETCLKAYQICWDSNGTNCETIPDNNSTGFTIDNLVACTTYNISVAALGISGSSENVTFTNITAPNPVRSVSQSKKTTQYVILNWKPPDRGNECLESFAIYVCDHTKNIVNEKLIAIIPGSITMFNYTGLEACAGVLVNIKTMDQHKSTSDLGSGQFYLQAGGEDVKNIWKFVGALRSERAIYVRWETAHESLDCVQQFEICWSQTERGSAIEGGCDVVTSSSTWFSIPGMVHGKGYRVEMMIIYFGGQTSEKYVLNVPKTPTLANVLYSATLAEKQGAWAGNHSGPLLYLLLRQPCIFPPHSHRPL